MFVLQWSFSSLLCLLLWSMFSLFPPCSTHCLLLFLAPLFRPSYSSKVMRLMKDEHGPRNMVTITSCTPHLSLSHCLLLWLFCTYCTILSSNFSTPSFIPSVCHSLTSSSLIPPSTSCWCLLIAVMLMWTD